MKQVSVLILFDLELSTRTREEMSLFLNNINVLMALQV